jgi:DNA-binding XRE family transcriptional regulator
MVDLWRSAARNREIEVPARCGCAVWKSDPSGMSTSFEERVEFARRARGLHVTDISPGRHLTADPQAGTVLRLAEALNTSPGWLLDERPVAVVPDHPGNGSTPSRDELAVMIGRRIRAAREWRGMTIVEVAHVAGWNGEGLLQQYEHGRHAPKLAVARRLAAALNVPVEWLLAGEGPDPWD